MPTIEDRLFKELHLMEQGISKLLEQVKNPAFHRNTPREIIAEDFGNTGKHIGIFLSKQRSNRAIQSLKAPLRNLFTIFTQVSVALKDGELSLREFREVVIKIESQFLRPFGAKLSEYAPTTVAPLLPTSTPVQPNNTPQYSKERALQPAKIPSGEYDVIRLPVVAILADYRAGDPKLLRKAGIDFETVNDVTVYKDQLILVLNKQKTDRQSSYAEGMRTYAESLLGDLGEVTNVEYVLASDKAKASEKNSNLAMFWFMRASQMNSWQRTMHVQVDNWSFPWVSLNV